MSIRDDDDAAGFSSEPEKRDDRDDPPISRSKRDRDVSFWTGEAAVALGLYRVPHAMDDVITMMVMTTAKHLVDEGILNEFLKDIPNYFSE